MNHNLAYSMRMLKGKGNTINPPSPPNGLGKNGSSRSIPQEMTSYIRREDDVQDLLRSSILITSDRILMTCHLFFLAR